MLSNILGFGGRLGRLEYFLLCLALGFATMLVVLAMVFGSAPHLRPGIYNAPHHTPTALIVMLLVIVLPIYLWFSLAFQAKRIRDIGWNPLHVILGWIGLMVLDRMVGMAVPALALGTGGTLIGALLNLAMGGVLLFWPSGPADTSWSEQVYHTGSPAPEAPRPAMRSAAPAPSWTPAPAPTGFGRRGL
jgi:uncharacterized membrane protein YhaH (DUF805 family)